MSFAATLSAATTAMTPAAKRDAAMDKTAKDFESMFMSQMLQPMYEGLESDGMFGGGHGEEVMRGMMLQEYGKAMTQGSASSLTDAIKGELIRMQEKASGEKNAKAQAAAAAATAKVTPVAASLDPSMLNLPITSMMGGH